jgi:hypothetical protein
MYSNQAHSLFLPFLSLLKLAHEGSDKVLLDLLWLVRLVNYFGLENSLWIKQWTGCFTGDPGVARDTVAASPPTSGTMLISSSQIVLCSNGGAGAYVQSEHSPLAASFCTLLRSETSFLVLSDHWLGMAGYGWGLYIFV